MKGVPAVKLGKARAMTFLAAAALSLYALAGIAAAGAEIERYSQTVEAFSEKARELKEENAELELLLREGRSDRDEIIEKLAGERLNLVLPGQSKIPQQTGG